MSMTKKDFEGLAAALRGVGLEDERRLLVPRANVITALVDFCAAQNPNFDAERFTRAILKAPAPAAPPTVYVHVEGGAVSIGKPKGVAVEVVDFDTDGADAAALCDGRGCEVHRDHAHKVYDAATREVL